MKYLIDVNHRPAVVVLMHEDTMNQDDLAVIGRRYANQVGRPLVVAEGPSPSSPTFSPVIDEELTVVPTLPQHVEAMTVPVQPALWPEATATADVLGGLGSSFWDVLRKLEPAAIELIIQLLRSLTTK